MTKHNFALQAFQKQHHDIKLSGQYEFIGREIHISYDWQDPNAAICWPGSCQLAEIQDELWQQTFCEIFIARAAAHEYWEYNFSPAGHWNCYRFKDYRASRQSRTQGLSTEIIAVIKKNLAKIKIKTNLPASVEVSDLSLNICAIAKTQEDTIHFALRHHGDKPDFHLRTNFELLKYK